MSDHPRILIVDDEPVVLKVLAICCREAGFEATPARDGCEALELAQANPYQLIITDQQMPRMNGTSFCRQVRESARHALTPIIICSSAIAELDTTALRAELEPVSFIAKPISVTKLTQDLTKFAESLVAKS